ncbi:hypothetical protein [Clostridium sp.]|uniref:hypothetical protein n=1 Tax=Clostridium sp. TaxID=1506 RepID=UPI002FC7643C
MASVWENYLLLRVGNAIFIIIALILFLAIIVKLFKNTFITHCSSENVWRNIELYFCAIATVYLAGIVLITSIGNGYAIAELETIGNTMVNGVLYKEVLLSQVQGSFRYIVTRLVLGGIFYFFYIRAIRAINLELEELRKKVIHKRLY